TLWRLTGMEMIDVSGPVAVAADARGSLNNPEFRGSLRAQGARVESAITGTVIENVAASGRFGGSRLVIDSFSGTTKNKGALAAPWKLDLDVDARNRLMVTGLGINSEWSADLKIEGTVTEPRVNGEANLIRGNYDFAGRRFKLERGVIRFLGESPINPALDIA